MDTSRRAVEAYWRSRMIDGVTSDEDKVAPVYKLDEVCELLRTSHAGIVKEVSDYIVKRLDHKSPIVKQKALRLIKFAVAKSGTDFRREMQRQSTVVKQLFHYKGYPDPLKGDALNKAVRDTAHEAVSAIFSSDDYKGPVEPPKKRMEGFGSTNFDLPSEDKKSFLSEVVGLGSASIKQGLSTIAAAHSLRKNDNGSYRSPQLHRSLTKETESHQRYERDDQREVWKSPANPKNLASGSWAQDPSTSIDVGSASGSTNGEKSREERLLEKIVTSSGVRLQPTRDAIQVFLSEATKLNSLSMSQALDSKLQSHLWQVRMKAMCVLESILKSKEDLYSSAVRSYFVEHGDSVAKCSESPQASLRDKAYKVLNLLNGDSFSGVNLQKKPEGQTSAESSAVSLPDLIDTGEADICGSDDNTVQPTLQGVGSLVDDLFGPEPVSNPSTSKSEKVDPFADVSFHPADYGGHPDDLFAGLAVDEKRSDSSLQPELIEIFGSTSKGDVNDLMAGLTMDSQNVSMGSTNIQNSINHEGLDGLLGPQMMMGVNQSSMFPSSSIPNDMQPPGIVLTHPYPMHQPPLGYGFIPQQQLLFPNFGQLGAGIPAASSDHSSGQALPDIFQLSSNPAQVRPAAMNTPKEDTRAFDFISDHVSAARSQKRLV